MNKPNYLTVTRSQLLVGAQDQEFRSMLYDFFAFGSILDDARSGFAAYVGLSPTQYLSLIAIARVDRTEPLGISQVAKRLHLSGAFVTIEVNKLVQEGLVEKRPHPEDGRRVQLYVTPEGREKLVHLATFQRPVNDALFKTLSGSEFNQLRDMLRRLAEDGPKALQLAKYFQTENG